MNKIILIIIIIMISFPLFSASPTIVLGAGAKTLLFSDRQDNFHNDWVLHTDGLFSYRNKLSDNGYYSFLSGITGTFSYTDPYLYSDEEVISLETGFHFKNSKLILLSSFESSITGTAFNIPYFCPEWEILYYFITERKKIQPYLSYQGYYLIEPESEEDIFYEGTEIGIKHRPTITNGYGVSIGIGWENWPEYPVYSSSGTVIDEIRNDFLCIFNGKIQGIIRYFFDWEILLSVLLRYSNSNYYYKSINYFDEKSEDRIVITSEINLEWSPSRFIHIKIHPFISPVFYFNKQALTTESTLMGEKTWSFSSGCNVHINWTPNNKFYIFFKTEGMTYFSNYLNELNWNIFSRLGLEYSLKV